ncbi:MAG TPA: hypothetical protein VFC01_05230 [Mycobacterium sp.]|nr:hypothetical protein [Mycobacterium sp.]
MISTAKIVVTLTAGIAATFVAAELQVNERNPWEKSAALLLIPMLCATFWVLWLRAPSHDKEIGVDELRTAKSVADRAHWLMLAQVAFSVLSGLFAVLGLLIPSDTGQASPGPNTCHLREIQSTHS